MVAPAVIAVNSGRVLLPTLFGCGLGLSLNGSLPAIPNVVKAAIGLPSSPSSSQDSNLLMAQIAELRNAISSRSQVTVVSSDSQQSGWSLGTIGFVAVAAGSGYVILRWSGFGLKDLYWVSKSTFDKGVEQLAGGLDFLEKRLEQVKLGLSSAIELVSKKQEQVIENQESLQNSLEQVDLSVEGVREQVSGLQHTMFGVASNVDSVKSKQDEAGVKIDKWGKGIQLLCDVVGDSVSEHPQLQHKAIALKRFASESGLLTDAPGEIEKPPLPARRTSLELHRITSGNLLPMCREESRNWRSHSITSEEA